MCYDTLTSVWKDPRIKADRSGKSLLLELPDKPAIKRLYEDEFVRELKLKGVDAVPAYSVLPAEGVADKEMIRSKVTELTIDAILLTRMVDKKTVDTYYPPETISPARIPMLIHRILSSGLPSPGVYDDWLQILLRLL